MASLSEMIQLCRLCLVKDHVNIPIFDDPENVRQIPLKISSCLPVKISIDDNLPKKICDGCSNKLDLCYEFWNSTAHAEKTLLAMVEEKENQVPEAEMPQPFLLKVEAVESLEESQNQICEPPVPKPIPTLVKDEEEAEDPPAKRPRRSAAIQAQMQIIPESDDEDDAAEGLATTKEVAEMDDDFEDPDVPDMIVDIDEVKPGPSGLNQTGVNSQFREQFDDEFTIDIKEEPLDTETQIANYKTEDELDHKFEEFFLGFQGFDKLEQHSIVCHNYEAKPVIESKSVKCEVGLYKEHSNDIQCKGAPAESNQTTKDSEDLSIKSVDKSRIKAAKNSYYCKECKKCFASNGNFKLHLKIHTDGKNKQHKCQECGISFANRIKLRVHLRTHSCTIALKCKECDESFTSKTSLQRHIQDHSNEKRFKCSKCKKCFATTTELKIHLRIHNGLKIFKCNECNKCFLREILLQRHVQVHTGKKSFICNECNTYFSDPTTFQRHLRGHISAKPYKCTQCETCFERGDLLTNHWRRNHCLKPFKCNECDATFARERLLCVHFKIHTDGKPFKCNECGSGFSQKAHLQGHVRRIHGDEKP